MERRSLLDRLMFFIAGLPFVRGHWINIGNRGWKVVTTSD